jgi:UDP-N-acetylmuramate-alanine ligase
MPRQDVYFVSTLVQATRFLLEGLHPGDVLLVLSAGDADQISTDVLSGLSANQSV